MAVIYDAFLEANAKGLLPLDTGEFRALLVKSGTTVPSQNATINTLSDFTTLGELSGTGYVRVVLTGLTITRNSTLHRAEWRSNVIEWPILAPDNGTITGILIFAHPSNIPVIFEPLSLVTNGSPVRVTPNTAGIMYSKQGP